MPVQITSRLQLGFSSGLPDQEGPVPAQSSDQRNSGLEGTKSPPVHSTAVGCAPCLGHPSKGDRRELVLVAESSENYRGISPALSASCTEFSRNLPFDKTVRKTAIKSLHTASILKDILKRKGEELVISSDVHSLAVRKPFLTV